VSEFECKRHTFIKEEHVRTRDDIKKLFLGGHRVSCNGAKLFFLRNNREFNRIAFTFPRKFGNAVQRNRAKRVGREAYRLSKHRLKTGYDMVLLVYPGNDTLSYRARQLEKLMDRAGLHLERDGVS